jgi:NAD(P)-dependent dehydrogenase (short-subunit alcohol dehydrogenase family)
MDLSEKVVVITGASMGIGGAIAKLFADHGASIVFSSRELARAEAARARVGRPQQSLAVACDVCDPAQISALLRATLERFGKVDIWVNNAGFGLVDSIERMDRQTYRRMFETNLFGAIDAMQQVIPVMRRQRSGSIINISSVAGYIAVPFMGAYGATKRALNGISRAARLELEGTGVSVINICPGYVRTGFGENAVRGAEGMRITPKLQRGITAERVAQAVLRAYQCDTTETVVPWHNRIVIGLAFLAPFVIDYALRQLVRQARKR